MNKVNLPKSLLVIGNGFDLSCGLQSNYKSFLIATLSYKTGESQSDVIEKIKQSIEKYMRFWNFYHDSQKQLTEKIGDENSFIQDLNIWYLLFVYKDMVYDSDWYLVENQIATELLSDHNGINIVEKIGDTLLSIYREGRGQYRTPQFCQNKASIFERDKLINKIYELLAYCLLYKKLDNLSDSGRAIYKDLRDTVQELGNEYSLLLSQNRIYSEIYNEVFEQKLTSVLFPLVAQVLLVELNELELDFKQYLKECITTTQGKYQGNADSYFRNILTLVNIDRGYREMLEFNVLSFNYTTPWEVSTDETLKKIFDSINIHGKIMDNAGIIFGIDDEDLKPMQAEFMFTKVYRTLDLITMGSNRTNFDGLLLTNIENVVFYGHSLSIADYGYFRMIIDKYVDTPQVKFYFVFKVYKGTTEEKERKKLVKNITEIFGKYSIDKENTTDIFKKLIQNNRIKIINLD